MLTSLQIENFALIDALTLDFGSGLNVLTGETGAGKSIILDAIDAVLGGKVSRRFVRTGADRALIEATFHINPELIAGDLDAGISLENNRLVCTRELTVSGNSVRNRSKVNGVQVNKQQMEALRDRLVEITAQGQTMQLGRAALQREWLDGFGGSEVLQQRDKVATAYAAAQQAFQRLEKRRQAEQERLQQLDLFEYQAKELAQAALTEPDELEQLEQEYQRLSHSVELQQQSYEVYQALYQNEHGGDACADLLGRAEGLLSDMLQYDPQIQSVLDMVTNALAQVEEAGREINAYGADIETDPERLQEIEHRISVLKQICRKYGPTLADAIAYDQKIRADLDEITGGAQSVEELEATYRHKQAALEAVCEQLTQMRRQTAQQLEQRLIAELKPLAMDKVQFTVQLVPITPTVHGADRVTFLFSPNPGEPPQPLDEVASGGEMSRFLLAFKACFSQVDAVGTMVFDEIDVGVSGRVAQAIAEKLHHLSRSHQVLCVTHQPLVAAMADQHFRVNKQVIEETSAVSSDKNGKTPKATAEDIRTVVRVAPLDNDERREELAQLAGGPTAQEAITFADALLSQANTIRESRSLEAVEQNGNGVANGASGAASSSTATQSRSKSSRSKSKSKS